MATRRFEVFPNCVVIEGVPVPAVRLQIAAIMLGTTLNALKLRIKKNPKLAVKGLDGLVRMRVSDINAIIGLGEDMNWAAPPEKKPAAKIIQLFEREED